MRKWREKSNFKKNWHLDQNEKKPTKQTYVYPHKERLN